MNPTYKSWQCMKQRCNNPNFPKYEIYGGRGITYDPTWESFINFFNDMGPRPEGKTLDRLDNNGNYEKSNCRWATGTEQRINQRPIKAVRRDSSRKICGVTFDRKGYVFRSYVTVEGFRQDLYRGKDFFEACCARKSYEARTFL